MLDDDDELNAEEIIAGEDWLGDGPDPPPPPQATNPTDA